MFLLTAFNFANGQIKKPDNRRMPASQLLERIRELSVLQERDEMAVEYLEDQLVLAVSWDNARKFQNQLTEVRQKVEDRQRSNLRSYDGARAWEKKMKLVDRIKGNCSICTRWRLFLISLVLAVLKQLQTEGVEDVDSISAAKITSVEIEVTPDAQIVLLPPSNLYRRMEKLFAVAVDRSMDKSRQRTLVISGLEKDVETSVEFLQQADWAGGCKVAVDSKLLPLLIGKGGSGIRQLEETFKCFFQTRENNDIVIYGTKANATKAIQNISQMKMDRTADQAVAVIPVDHAAIARALTSMFSKAIRDIEAKHAITIRVASGPPPNSTNTPEAPFGADVSAEAPRKQNDLRPATSKPTSVLGGPTITIRGTTKAGVDGAHPAVTKLVSTLRALEIPIFSPEAIKRLFYRVSFNGVVDVNRGPNGRSNQLSVGDRFCDLVGLNSDVAFLRHGDALALVGTAEAISKVHDEAKSLVDAAGFTPAKVAVQGHQLPIFSSARLAEIAEATGASLSIRRLRNSENAQIEIVGNEAQKEKALEMVNEIVKNEAVTEVVKIVDRETLNQLLRSAGASIRSLEEQHGTRISVDRQQMSCTIMGGLKGIASAKNALLTMDANNAQLETRSITIPSADMIRRLIGTKGATISQIRATSKIDNIDVNDKDLVAIIRGTLEACDDAEKQINELFSTSVSPLNPCCILFFLFNSVILQQRPPRNNNIPSTSPTTTSHKAQTVVAASASYGLGWGESVLPEGDQTTGSSPQSSSPNSRAKGGWGSGGSVRTVSTSESAFPSLGEIADIAKQTKRPHRRRRPAAVNGKNDAEEELAPFDNESSQQGDDCVDCSQ